ncbi:hypothetical protein CORC01_11438 [Colletotrichum orchidophilum]|uniref:Uncharacterized protein n=1 Tax=Colletotrichum orchidophilum TaxID=1209926 RepID=A0A1G4AW00_9PEZI|nr:uncharacterized protein CORC01_11438 [Colletotrichum orchidophilum]OHE93295.1 hypothetical protein CORC01_11438 [Colletotrichum orchidophilum]
MKSPSLFRAAFNPFEAPNDTAGNLQGTGFRPTVMMDWARVNDGWDAAELLFEKHHVFLEILWISSTYMRFLVPSWKKVSTPTHAKYAKLPWIPLMIHVIVGTTEMFRYYYPLAIAGEPPVPNWIDLVLGLVFSAGSFHLAAYVREGNIPFIRTTFQATAVQRALASTLGYVHGDAQWHRASIKLLNNFTWVRWLSTFGTYLQGFRTYGETFTATVVMAHPLSLWEGDYPAGIPLYASIVLALLAVDKWASRKLDGKTGFVPRVLANCGLVTVKKGYLETSTSGEKLE